MSDVDKKTAEIWITSDENQPFQHSLYARKLHNKVIDRIKKNIEYNKKCILN